MRFRLSGLIDLPFLCDADSCSYTLLTLQESIFASYSIAWRNSIDWYLWLSNLAIQSDESSPMAMAYGGHLTVILRKEPFISSIATILTTFNAARRV